MTIKNELDFLDYLTIFSVGLQVMGYANDIEQTSNDDLMRELQKQDSAYFREIIDNQREILRILRKE